MEKVVITEKNIKEIVLTRHLMDMVKTRPTFEPNNRSYMGGGRQLEGNIGEVVVKEFLESLGLIVEFSGNYDWDLTAVQEDGTETRIDLKTKRRPAVWNLSDLIKFEGSVQANSLEDLKSKNVDMYIFVNVTFNGGTGQNIKAYIMGGILKSDFIAIATERKKGDSDKSNGIVFTGNNFNINYRDIQPLYLAKK